MEIGVDAVAMLEALPEPAFLLREGSVVAAANARAHALVGEELVGRPLSNFHVGNADSFEVYLKRCRGSKSVLVGSLYLRTGDGTTHHQCRANRVNLSSCDALLLRLTQTDETRFKLLTAKVDDLNRQIKQRRHTEAVLNEALRDRDVLLRELQHRVKNNMHMLSGLLAGTERETTSPEAKSVLRDASMRFAAVSAVQQLLYGSNLEFVQSDALISAIITSACSLGLQRIEIDLKIEAFPVPISIAASMALVLNEILTNAVKYGRPVASSQRLTIECCKGEDRMQVLVADNGPGFSLRETSKRASGIGLVRGLLRQLGGSFAVESGPGARCKIEIPLPAVQ
jgi:two-component sensor histidine kinase